MATMSPWQGFYRPVLLALLAIWVQCCQCQVDAPSPKDFRWRTLQSVAVLGNYLYIDGGEVSQDVNGKADPAGLRRVNSTLSIALDQSWTSFSLSIQTIPKGGSPTLKTPALWPDESAGVMYAWSGEGNRTEAQNVRLWKLTPDGKGDASWAAGSRPGGDIYSGTAGTSVACAGRGYLLGGYGTYLTDEHYSTDTPQTGMLIYDLKSGSWENVTAPAPYSPYLYGQGVCLPFGAQSLVMFLGGAQTRITDRSALSFVPFDHVTFYDPSAGQWYTQKTTGEIPDNRKRFCAVGAAGPDGTYDIFVYGGLNPLQEVESDVYILSIPAFQWFRVPGDSPRVDHRCALAGRRHMISVGGNMQADDPRAGDPVNPSHDPWSQGIGVFDLATLTWTQKYDPSAGAYDSPSDVKDWYKNNSLDSVPWASEAVKGMFVNATTAKLYSSQGTTTPAKSPPVAAIAGGVVGGVALLVILAAAAFLWHRRRARQATNSEPGKSSFKYDPVQDTDLDYGYRAGVPNQEPPTPPDPNHQRAMFPHELSTTHEYHEAPPAH